MKRIELFIILVLGVFFCSCSKEKPQMPAAHPFPRVGFGTIEHQMKLLIETKTPTNPDSVRQRYQELKSLISILLQEGAMVDDILTRSQGEKIESLLRHERDDEASSKVDGAIHRLRNFRKSDEFNRLKEELGSAPTPQPHLTGESHRKKIWLRQQRHPIRENQSR
jgi:hypothetical protein